MIARPAVPAKWRTWGVVLAAVIGFAISPATVLFYTLGLFIDPLHSAFGWDRAQVSLAIPIFTGAVALSMPVVGLAIDRLGPRRVLLWSIMLYGGGLSGAFLVDDLNSFYIMFLLLGIGCAGANSITYTRLLTVWFDRNRGKAIGIASSGMGLGMLIMPPIIDHMIGVAGWQWAYCVVGLVVLSLGLPAAGLLIVDTPQEAGLEPEPPAASAALSQAVMLTLRQSMTTRQFWLILTCFVGIAGSTNAIAIHLAPMLLDLGASSAVAAAAVSAFGAAMLAGRLVMGWLVDRFFAPFACAFVFGASTIAIVALAMGLPMGWAIVAAICVGFSAGAEGDVLGFLIGRYFGITHYARIYAVIFMAYLLSVSALPYLLAQIFETVGSYRPGLWMCAALNLMSVACLSAMGPYGSTTRTGKRA
ncbi:MFS transporter [Sphingomonadaceae bacterium G21617-S1]|nr:MFS transporter [Sphingomonadaceae bacterium G21617-S1]TAK08622.1 MAG: MFS transporter [Rhizorhabdus sp.]